MRVDPSVFIIPGIIAIFLCGAYYGMSAGVAAREYRISHPHHVADEQSEYQDIRPSLTGLPHDVELAAGIWNAQ